MISFLRRILGVKPEVVTIPPVETQAASIEIKMAAKAAREKERERKLQNYLRGEAALHQLWIDFQREWRKAGRSFDQPTFQSGSHYHEVGKPPVDGSTLVVSEYKIFVHCSAKELVRVSLNGEVIIEETSLVAGIERVRSEFGEWIFGHRVEEKIRPNL